MRSPDDAVSRPPKIFRKVDLPAPDAPRIIANSFFSISKFNLSFAMTDLSPIV